MFLKYKLSVALLLFAMIIQFSMANSSAYWKMNEGENQILKNSISGGVNGWLGNSAQKDDADPLWLKDDKRNILSFEAGKWAKISDGKYSDFSKSNGFSIQVWFKPLIDFSGKIPRIQLLTKGADSGVNCWQLRMLYHYKIKKNILSFMFKDSEKKYNKISVPIADIADKWNRVTVTGNGKLLKLYLNGKLMAKNACNGLPRKNRYPLNIGAYAFGGKFCFTGNIKDLKIYKSEIVPAKFIKTKPDKVLLNSDFKTPAAVKAWHPVNGKWFWSTKAYCEYSDKKTPKGIWSVSGNPEWENYCLNTTVSCIDGLGSILLGIGWKNIDNHYELMHQSTNSGMSSLSIIKVKNGERTILAETDSSEKYLPVPAKNKNINYKIYFYKGIIAVMIDGKFYLSVRDKNFLSGKVALGEQNRKIRVKRVSVRELKSFTNPIKPKQISPVSINIKNPDLRHAFCRGEKINLNLYLRNNTAKVLAASALKITIDNGIDECKIIKFDTIASGLGIREKIILETKSWKSGKYKLTAQIENMPYLNSYDIFIAPEKRKDTYKFYSWGGRTDVPFFESLEKHGFNGTSISLPASTDFRKQKAFLARVLDQAVKHGQDIKVSYSCLWSKTPSSDTRIVRYDGSKGKAPNPWNPEQRKWSLDKIKELTTVLKGHPAISDFLLNSENENIAEPDYSEAGRKRAKKELGFDMPVPANQKKEKDGTAGRVISVPKAVKTRTPVVFKDSNKWYRFFKWFWQRGYGDNYLNEDIKNIIKQKFPDAKVTHDPFRDVPLFHRNKGLDQIGTWFYTHPDASETLGAAETLVNATQGEKKTKGINFGASLWLYDNKICPAKNRYAGVQPTDIIIESDWLAFSRIPEVIEHYSLTHLMPSARPQFKQKNIYDKLMQFSKEILQPLWPTVSRLKRAPRKCAMLLSFGSQLFGNKIWSGYGGSSGFGYYAALQKAHIPTDIIFDENIQRGDLSKYKVLFMHSISHLPKSVFDKIIAFTKNGGTVICGEPFAKLIPGAVKFDMDMTKRKKSTYYHIQNKGGFTADIVYQDMLKKAAMVRDLLKNKIKNYADCDSSEVFLNVLEKNGAKYVFVVNDKRTFGDYVGKKYRAVMEQGLSQTVNVNLRTKNAAVYDLVSHRKLNTIAKGEQTVVSLKLKPAWGAILAVYPQEISKVDIVIPQTLIAGEESKFTIKVIDKNGKPISGVQPLKVVISDPEGHKNEFSGYFATKNGVCSIKFIPAQNDIRGQWTIAAEELSSSIRGSKKITFLL
jgi:Concanavalin A-like lectin/glucanases superfamily/Beta-galactosidase trimerisation domain